MPAWEDESLAGLVLFIHAAPGHGRPCRAGDVFQSKHEKNLKPITHT